MDPKGLQVWSNNGTAVALDATADNVATFITMVPINVVQIGILVTVAGTSGTVTVGFDRRVLPGSDTGRVNHGVGYVEKVYSALAVGQILKKQVESRLDKGDQLTIQVEAAWGTTGDGIPFIVYYPAGEATIEYDADSVAISVESD